MQNGCPILVRNQVIWSENKISFINSVHNTGKILSILISLEDTEKEAVVIFILNAAETTNAAGFYRKAWSAHINEASVSLTVRNWNLWISNGFTTNDQCSGNISLTYFCKSFFILVSLLLSYAFLFKMALFCKMHKIL